MAQRDYEDQPEAPDLGASIQLETSQTLAGPPGDVDGLEAGYVPPDRPYALDDDEMTVAGQRADETLEQRLAREVPEDLPVDADRAGRLTLAGEGAAMERPDDIDGIDVGISGGGASAEEAAMHIVEPGFDAVDEDRPLDDPDVAEALTADPGASAAEVDAARDLRATDAADDLAGRDVDAGDLAVTGEPGEVSNRRGSGLSGTEPDPAYPHDLERDPALPDPEEPAGR